LIHLLLWKPHGAPDLSSAPTVPWSLVWAHGLHRKSPEHGVARLRTGRRLRVTWQGPRFSGARNSCGWQVVHRPPARLILKPTANQGIRGVHARIGLWADSGRILLDPVWGRVDASRCHRRTPRNHQTHDDAGRLHLERSFDLATGCSNQGKGSRLVLLEHNSKPCEAGVGPPEISRSKSHPESCQ